jgi:hypothetical protein
MRARCSWRAELMGRRLQIDLKTVYAISMRVFKQNRLKMPMDTAYLP